MPKEPESEREGPLWELSFSLPDGTRVPATFEEAEKVFCNFPRAETSEELAKIRARRMTNGYVVGDDKVGNDESENDSTP